MKEGEQNEPLSQAEELPLQGKVGLVTGGSRGIGRAIAQKLASRGCDLVVNYFNSHDEAEALQLELKKLGRRVVLAPGNVGDPTSVDEIFSTLEGEFSQLDFLISNAASGILRPTRELTLKHWRWCLETNALALNLLAQRAVNRMPDGGRIIALSSLGAERFLPDYAFIGASKAALEALVRALAVELAPRGIRVNAVSAGVVETDALQFFPQKKQLSEEFRRRSLVGRLLQPEDVARVVYLLCLPEADMICGQTIRVDAGYSIVG